MRTLVVDDSRLATAALARIIERIDPNGECTQVLSASEALARCKDEPIDVVFLDIEMPGSNGLEVAQRLKLSAPQTNVVFVTGYPEYALDAWHTQASAFLVKPVDEDDVRRALDNLRVPVGNTQGARLFVRCFGNFEVFFDQEPVCFERHQTKELLAYLVDRRGAFVSTPDLVAVLWEGLPDTASRRSQVRTLISDLRHTMARLDHPNAVVKRRGDVAIMLADDECDYFGFLRGNPGAVNRYRGEYMRQLSWAEMTAALLEQGMVER